MLNYVQVGLANVSAAAHEAVLKFFREYKTSGMYDPPNLQGTIIFPGVDGGGEWGGPAFDPETALLYVNSNEMPWFHKLVPRNARRPAHATARTPRPRSRTLSAE